MENDSSMSTTNLAQEFIWALDYLESIAYPEGQSGLYDFIYQKRKELEGRYPLVEVLSPLDARYHPISLP